MAYITREPACRIVEYGLVFKRHRDDYGWSEFPCDENGNVNEESLMPEALANLANCRAHADEYEVAGEIVRESRIFRPAPILHCDCRHEFPISGRGYYGAWQCPDCGRWYDRNGSHILPPSQWEEPLDPD